MQDKIKIRQLVVRLKNNSITQIDDEFNSNIGDAAIDVLKGGKINHILGIKLKTIMNLVLKSKLILKIVINPVNSKIIKKNTG